LPHPTRPPFSDERIVLQGILDTPSRHAAGRAIYRGPSHPHHLDLELDWICLLKISTIAIFLTCLVLLAVALGAALIAFTMGLR
jgi:hypothetical protein